MTSPEVGVPREALRQSAAALPHVQLLVLFGSRAQGRPRRDSDLDLAVLVAGSAPYLAVALATS